ncbi:MAG: alanine--tRNA ligase [Synoicihabitans sp.]
MTSAEIRHSFLQYFAQQQHTIVPSASLMPDSPGLLFTNAGMNQFVPFFLGDQSPNVADWAGAQPGSHTRAADTQKCIRAGGKHNDLEDVGYDTYHHTLFEMLGNWSFGDYFKTESINWGWELLTKVWGMPPKRLFATVYRPDTAAGDPSEFDQEAYDIWKAIFEKEGLDPAVHIVDGNKKDNFWMMGDTGPCGPCSEVHFNLMESDDEAAGRELVNQDSPRCIEIWNHVFIQFNANADGSFSPLAAKHVDTGMGFERVAGIYATTDGFKDFSAEPSNYAADIFTPLFSQIAELSGKTYAGTVPTQREGLSEQEKIDVAFRVIADHARCVACAIADNILPSNEGRNYVIRRILRRGILYGKKLGLQTGFFEQLVAPVVTSLGDVFPELKEKQTIIGKVIHAEEENFGKTLDRGLTIFNEATHNGADVSGATAFQLYDTFGFPLDMTELLATERGLKVDVPGFEKLMAEQRQRSQAAQTKEVVVAATEDDQKETLTPTEFVGYERSNLTQFSTNVVELVEDEKNTYLIVDRSPFYAEMGGQAGDSGTVTIGDSSTAIEDTIKDKAGRFLHRLSEKINFDPESAVELNVDVNRRRAISRHHSATHLIHWALRKVLGTHVHQAGTHKTPDRLRFDFAHFEAMTPEQIATVEELVNQQVIDNATVESYETDFDKKPEGTLAFFGEKYGKVVRVVDMGGYSRELCGGTHVETTGEIGLIKIVGESAIAAGTRRIEAVAGAAAFALMREHENALRAVSAKLHAGPQDVDEKLTALLNQKAEADQKLKSFEQKASANLADDLIAAAVEKDGLNWISRRVEAANPNALRTLGSQVSSQLDNGVVILGAAFGEKVSVVAFCSPAAIKAGLQAGKLVAERSIALGGRGGGKPDFAMGGGRDASKLDEVLSLD